MASETKTGTFLVTAADGASAVFASVEDGQVCALAENPGYEADEVVAGTLEAADPMGVTWRVRQEDERWTPTIVALDEDPATRARSAADGRTVGELTQLSVEDGELHVLAVDPASTGSAVEDVVADETTRRVAARLGARRVEVRGADGVVAVRYLG